MGTEWIEAARKLVSGGEGSAPGHDLNCTRETETLGAHLGMLQNETPAVRVGHSLKEFDSDMKARRNRSQLRL